MSTYYTQAIILSQTDRGEADQLFSLYTHSHGKALAVARGARKVKSKLRGHLQMFSLLNIMIAPGKGYDHVAGVTIERRYKNVAQDLRKIVLATYAMELVDSFTKPSSADDRIFGLLIKYFDALEEHDFSETEWQLVKQAFVIKLLTLLGFEPPAEVAQNPLRLEKFLQHHLEVKLQTEAFISRLKS